MKSNCLCAQRTTFTKVINFSALPAFPQYQNIIIGRCNSCGQLKTFWPKKSTANPQASRAAMYEEHAPALQKEFAPLLRSLHSLLPNKAAVLDVGCASGILVDLLNKEGFHAWGIEPNKKAFRLAQKKLGRKVFLGTLKKYLSTKPTQKFDCLIYNHVLEHVTSPLAELSLVKKILKPGGLLIIGVPNVRNFVFALRRGYWESLMPLEHVWHFNDRVLQKVLLANGFRTLSKTFSNHSRKDYPLLKRMYFEVLIWFNKLARTSEAVLFVTRFIE